MSISLLTNLGSLNIRRYLEKASEDHDRANERVASGRRINRSLDDAAGLAISSRLESKIRSTQQAERTALDALSLIQVAEGGMNEVSNILVRVRELSIQAGSDNLSDEERNLLNFEGKQLTEEIERLAQSTSFSGTSLLNGSGKELSFQIGIENTEYDRISYDSGKINLTAGNLGVASLDLSEKGSALDGLENIDKAMLQTQAARAQLGALQARMHPMVSNLRNFEENLTAANARIRDADLAKESTELIRTQVQQKAAISVLAQANLSPALALKLIESG